MQTTLKKLRLNLRRLKISSSNLNWCYFSFLQLSLCLCHRLSIWFQILSFFWHTFSFLLESFFKLADFFRSLMIWSKKFFKFFIIINFIHVVSNLLFNFFPFLSLSFFIVSVSSPWDVVVFGIIECSVVFCYPLNKQKKCFLHSHRFCTFFYCAKKHSRTSPKDV